MDNLLEYNIFSILVILIGCLSLVGCCVECILALLSIECLRAQILLFSLFFLFLAIYFHIVVCKGLWLISLSNLVLFYLQNILLS